MQQQRLNKELTKLTNTPPQGICVFRKDDNNSNILEAKLTGPENSPYKTGIFTIEILIPDNYPFSPPNIKFITKVYHPNIDDNGRICLDLIKMPPTGSWKPTISLEGLLIAVRMLLESPNADDPLMDSIAKEYKNNYEEYVQKAIDFTEKFAKY